MYVAVVSMKIWLFWIFFWKFFHRKPNELLLSTKTVFITFFWWYVLMLCVFYFESVEFGKTFFYSNIYEIIDDTTSLLLFTAFCCFYCEPKRKTTDGNRFITIRRHCSFFVMCVIGGLFCFVWLPKNGKEWKYVKNKYIFCFFFVSGDCNDLGRIC